MRPAPSWLRAGPLVRVVEPRRERAVVDPIVRAIVSDPGPEAACAGAVVGFGAMPQTSQ
jgi:hypothetical protein